MLSPDLPRNDESPILVSSIDFRFAACVFNHFQEPGMAARALSKACAAKTWTDNPFTVCLFLKVQLPDHCQQLGVGASPRLHPGLGCS